MCTGPSNFLLCFVIWLFYDVDYTSESFVSVFLTFLKYFYCEVEICSLFETLFNAGIGITLDIVLYEFYCIGIWKKKSFPSMLAVNIP